MMGGKAILFCQGPNGISTLCRHGGKLTPLLGFEIWITFWFTVLFICTTVSFLTVIPWTLILFLRFIDSDNCKIENQKLGLVIYTKCIINGGYEDQKSTA